VDEPEGLSAAILGTETTVLPSAPVGANPGAPVSTAPPPRRFARLRAVLRFLFPALGSVLGGAIAGAVGGTAIHLFMPPKLNPGTSFIWLWSCHGAILAGFLHFSLRAIPRMAPRDLSSLLMMAVAFVAVGMLAGYVAVIPYSEVILSRYGGFPPWAFYVVKWGRQISGPVALAILLAHAPEILGGRRASGLLTLLLAGTGVCLAEVAVWKFYFGDWVFTLRSTNPSMLLAVTDGYAFGLCFVLGNMLTRGAAPLPAAPPPAPGVPSNRSRIRGDRSVHRAVVRPG